MNRKVWAGSAALAVAAVALLAWAFAPRAIPVDTATVTKGHFEASIEEDGKTRVRDRFVVSAPLAGLLQRITLREGDAVKADAVVATLTPVLPPLLDERTVREQRALVEAASANVQRATARIEGARVALQQARNELQRSQELASQGFVASTKRDNDQLAVKAAQKELDAATQERHAAAHEEEQARVALSVVQRGSDVASFTVRAPVDGRVLRVVQASEATVPLGAPLLELGDTRRMEVVAELLTTDALQARPGSLVLIERWGGEGTLRGRVRLVEPGGFTKVSALGVEEQRVRVLIDITTPPEQWAALGDAYRVGVRIVTREADDAVQVPISAVFPVSDGTGSVAVFLYQDGRTRLQPVELVARNGQQAWVKRGLQPGAVVIVYPPPGVADGVRVQRRKV